MRTNAAGIALIKHFESLRLNAYQDSVGVWTIGYGHTEGVARGQSISAHQAEVILSTDIERFEDACTPMMPEGANENEFSACVAFAFNVGVRAFATSTLLKKFKAGDTDGAAAEFPRWNKAGGQPLAGLTSRRMAERTLFLAPVAA